MNAKKIQKDMERWAKAKNRQQAKTAPKAEPEPQPQPVADHQPETNVIIAKSLIICKVYGSFIRIKVVIKVVTTPTHCFGSEYLELGVLLTQS